MPVPYQLRLSEAQRNDLCQTRDHAAKPYLRERAAVLPTYAPWLNPVEKVWRQLYARCSTCIPGSMPGSRSRPLCKPG